jgi:hypothetical protein
MKVIPIRSGRSKTEKQEVVELAFQNWLERLGLVDGSPEDDFRRAQREVMARGSQSRNRVKRLLVMRRSGS